MRPRIPRALRGLTHQQVGEYVRATGTWFAAGQPARLQRTAARWAAETAEAELPRRELVTAPRPRERREDASPEAFIERHAGRARLSAELDREAGQ